MTFEFLLPDLGEGMADVEVVEWFVAPGDEVTVDQALLAVETDKFSSELPSPVAGTVTTLHAEVGTRVAVGRPLVTIDTVGDVPAPVPDPAASAPAEPVPAEPARAVQVRAAPAVRKLALERGVDLASIAGSGPGGRVTREDVLAALDRPAPAAAADRPAPPRPPASGTFQLGTRVPLRGLRRQIAENLSSSWARIPPCVDFREADATGLIAARTALTPQEGRNVPSFTAFLIKFAAVALQRHPVFNSSLDEEAGEIHVHGEINIGVATATPDGIVVPVLHGADGKSIAEIAEDVERLAEHAQRRSFTADDLRGGTFTVNNVGALGPKGHAFPTPLINWPQAAILAFGRITDRVVAVDGEPSVRPVMLLTVNGDHRLIDGADITAFANDIVDLIERPAALLAELR